MGFGRWVWTGGLCFCGVCVCLQSQRGTCSFYFYFCIIFEMLGLIPFPCISRGNGRSTYELSEARMSSQNGLSSSRGPTVCLPVIDLVFCLCLEPCGRWCPLRSVEWKIQQPMVAIARSKIIVQFILMCMHRCMLRRAQRDR